MGALPRCAASITAAREPGSLLLLPWLPPARIRFARPDSVISEGYQLPNGGFERAWLWQRPKNCAIRRATRSVRPAADPEDGVCFCAQITVRSPREPLCPTSP